MGHLGPRICLEHFHQNDIVKTRISNGVRLKHNACPMSKSSGSRLVTDVTSDGTMIPTNTSLMAATSPVLKAALRYHDHFEDKIQLLLPDYSTETIETFLEMLHLGDVCISVKQVQDIKCFLSDLGIDHDTFTITRIDGKGLDEYISRYSSVEIAAGVCREGEHEGGPGVEEGQKPGRVQSLEEEEELQSWGGNNESSAVDTIQEGESRKIQRLVLKGLQIISLNTY